MLSNRNFSFTLPQNVSFGVGGIRQLPDKLKTMGIKKVLVVSDPGIAKSGLVNKITNILTDGEIDYVSFLEVESDPSSEVVLRAAELYKNSGAQATVCVGGGSSLDCGKVLSVVAKYGGHPDDYEGKDKIPGPIAPLFAIPTTAGTGSEVTPFAVVTSKNNVKMTIAGPHILPTVSILDPEVITTLPFSVAAPTCLDALTHAIEAYLSLAGSPFSDILAESAIELIGKSIRPFVANRSNIEAASGMMLGSTYAGLAFALARVGNIHGMTHPLGGIFHLTHGIAISAVILSVLKFNAMAVPEKYETIYRKFKGGGHSFNNFCPQMLVDEIESLLIDLKLPTRLSQVGIKESDLTMLAEETLRQTTLHTINPRATTLKDMEDIYRLAL